MGMKDHAQSDADDTEYLPPETKKSAKRRRLNKNGNIESLPKDVLINIFIRKPADYLYKTVRHVCKSWWNIIHDPCFIDCHLAYSKSSRLIFQANDRLEKEFINTISLNFNRKSLNKASKVDKQDQDACATIKASCNGLILTLSHDYVLAVSNLLTKQRLELPKLDPLFTHKWTTDFGFAYDRSTKKYKVAVSFVDNEMLFRCAIHTVGSDSWRVIKVPCTNIKNGRPPISTDDAGTLHWMTRCNTKKMPKSNECFKCHILSMKVSNEEFRITRDPPDSRIDDDNNSLVELGGSLSLLHYVSRREIDVWVLEDYYGETWQKKYCINISGSRFKCLPWGAHAFAASLEKGEVLIFVSYYNPNNPRRLFSYDLKQQKLLEVRAHLEHTWSWAQVLKFPCTHIESLVTLKTKSLLTPGFPPG